ncbi:hypothetical protein [Mesorhizobium huakuii]|uniref:Uncharacterized protein n=1 Tax=Mesorhizobium huakuii TaxID=28104 RepID=A0ABZ0VMM2_9HYPH|nr:hypothetical protein [Mesorhizobium huakuii]WQB98675.1 hypothetical protein U0R22_002839 [Mesorhizobium huakuii]
MELLRLILPIIWALTATAIGLVLYRSSSAFFEQKRNKDGETRRIRLVGSVVIASIAFFGLQHVTPDSSLTGVPPDSILISKFELTEIQEAAEQANAAMGDLLGCAAITTPSQCKAEMDVVRDRLNNIRVRLDASVK